MNDILPAERASVYVSAIARRWWLVVALAAVAGIVAFTFSSNQPKRYDASARVLLDNAEPVNVLLHAMAPQSFDPERALNTDIALVKLDSVAVRVRKQLKLRLTTAQLLSQVTAAPVGTSNIIAITARDESPKRAANIANAFAVRYVATLRSQAQGSYRSAAQLAKQQLQSLSRVQQRGAQGATLRQQLHQLQVAGALQTGGASLVNAAEVPTKAASPKPEFAVAVGTFLGLVLGALAAISLGAYLRETTPERELVAAASRAVAPSVD